MLRSMVEIRIKLSAIAFWQKSQELTDNRLHFRFHISSSISALKYFHFTFIEAKQQERVEHEIFIKQTANSRHGIYSGGQDSDQSY